MAARRKASQSSQRALLRPWDEFQQAPEDGTGTGVTRGLGQVPVIDILYPETQTSGPQSCQGWQSDGITKLTDKIRKCLLKMSVGVHACERGLQV